MQNKSKNSKKRCNCPFCRLFLSQLFEIGNSAGSLIGEAVNLFRTFQRLSATKTFATKFSSECEGMFSWATDLVKNIISSFQIQPFKDIELFWLYTVAIPLLILTFIPCLFNGYKQYRYFFFLGNIHSTRLWNFIIKRIICAWYYYTWNWSSFLNYISIIILFLLEEKMGRN